MRLHAARRLGALTSTVLLTVALAAPAAAAPTDRAEELRDRAATRSAEGATFGAADAFGTADTFGTAQDEQDVAATSDLRFACPQGRVPAGSFTDTAAPFAAAIDCLVWYGVTQGRTATTFEQTGTVTRAQMAVFVHRMLDTAVDLPEYGGTSAFRDVADSGFASREINVLASDEFADAFGARIVAGRDDGTFDPSGAVSRQQMSSFLGRAFRAIAEDRGATFSFVCENVFPDQDRISPVHRENVDLLCGFGITSGRADGTFGPTIDVTRGQMAAFIMRTFDVFANDDVQATLLPDRNFFVSGADCGSRQTGTPTDPFCTIQAAATAVGNVTDDVALVSVRRGGGAGGSYAEAVTLSLGQGANVFVVPQTPDGRTALEGSLAVTVPQGADLSIFDLDVTRGAGGPAVQVGGDGDVGFAGLEATGPVAMLIDQPGEGVTVVDAGTLTGTQRVVDVVRSEVFFPVDTDFVGTGADAFVVLPAGENPALLGLYTDPEFGNTFTPSGPVTGEIGGRPALIPAG